MGKPTTNEEFLAAAFRKRLEGKELHTNCNNCVHLNHEKQPWCAHHFNQPDDRTCDQFLLGLSAWNQQFGTIWTR